MPVAGKNAPEAGEDGDRFYGFLSISAAPWWPANEAVMTTLKTITAEGLEASCRALVRVESSNLGLEVQLPVIYPNGDLVTVVVTEENNQIFVHDGGFAAMTLATAGVALTKKMRVRVAALSKHYGCEFSNDRMVKTATHDDLPLAVAVVANASRTVADQLLQTHAQPKPMAEIPPKRGKSETKNQRAPKAKKLTK